MSRDRSLLTRLTIGKKCLALTIANTFLLLLVAATGFWGMHAIAVSTESLIQGEARLAEQAALVQNDVLECRRFEKDLFLNCLDAAKVEEYAKKLNDAQDRLSRDLDVLRGLATTEEDRSRVNLMSREQKVYSGAMASLIARARAGQIKSPQEGNQAIGEHKEAIRNLEVLAAEVAENAKQALGRTASETADTSRKTKIATMILSGAALVLGLVLSSLVSRSITRPLHHMSGVLENISAGAGDLTQEVQVTTTDEVGLLGGMVNALIRRIHDIVVPIRVAAIQLNATATEIAATATEQNATVQNFNASTTEIAASVRQITATSADLNRTMNEVKEGACEAATLADAGQGGLKQMAETMQQLSDATGSISTKLNTIREKAAGINGVVTTITKVADQTNLLSINAAIEAEKAGEAGRGFLVVAREIRRLADQTAVATLDIEQMVRQMQSAVSAGVMEMDRFSDRVQGCLHQTAEVNRQIAQVLEQVHSLNGRFQLVTVGMEQQNEGARQIGEAIHMLASSVQQVSASVREFTSAAANLRDSTDVLHREVGNFTVAS